MSISYGFGVYNTYKKLLHSCSGYQEAFEWIKENKDKDYVEVHYLFQEKPRKVINTKCTYIQRYMESGGGIWPQGPKYYFRRDKL